ncbi:MAG: exodeoxyribonuclease V subunit beta [Pseudomonadota bacterium]
MQNLDLSTCGLEGTNLIEASAGTGKTYTIAALFLRLIVEKNIPIEKILVVTFTRAATDELKERLYAVLHNAREVFSGREDCRDEFLAKLREKPDAAPNEKLDRLRRAIRDFDECAIYTIHSFCQRQLVDNAFAGGSLYDTRVVADLSEMIMDCLRDFWRSHIYGESPLVLGALLKKGIHGFFQLYRIKDRNPGLVIEAGAGMPAGREEIETAFADLSRLCRTLKKKWPDEPGEAVAWLELERKLLDGRSYRRDYVEKAATAIAVFVRSEKPVIDDDVNKELFWFSTVKLRQKAKDPAVIPLHPFFDLAAKINQQYEHFQNLCTSRLVHLQKVMFSYVEKRLEEHKKKENIQSFNDFLLRLQRSLAANSSGGELGEVIRKRYDAALIDEFQDTDPMQYAIFRALFAKKRILFLIGDPKQAIYSFRGADVYAYLQAAAQVDHRYTLPKNYRSDPLLVHGVNAVFSGRRGGNPFAEKKICFQPVEPAVDRSPLSIDGEENRPPLIIWTGAGQRAAEEKVTAAAASDMANRAILAEIHRLLSLAAQGMASIRENDGERRLRASDFAILVRNKAQMRPVQQILISHGIPAVVSSSGSIFDSEEAAAMELLLAAIASPSRMSAVSSALATPLFGMTSARLQEAFGDPLQWDEWVLAFKKYNDLFHARGFMAMFRRLLADHDVKNRLMGRIGGERSLTNFLHIAEILHLRQEEKGAGITELLGWFSSWRLEPSLREEERELRMESDEDAVRIVTIHKSKGLEYPIVFAPFVWGKSGNSENLCHDDQGQIVFYLDDEAFAGKRSSSFREALSENLRLFYVALTRARHRCYTFWTKFDGRVAAHTSAPAFLFHTYGPELDGEDPAGDMKKQYDGCKTTGEVRARLESFFSESRNCVSIADLPVAGTLPVLSLLPVESFLRPAAFAGFVPPARQITSFSGLSRDQHGEGDGRKDRDGVFFSLPLSRIQTVVKKEREFSIFTFPRGAKAGTFMHDMLEHLDFSMARDEAARKMVADGLLRYGFAGAFHPAICAMLERVVNQSLDGFTLAEVSRERRINELEFYFPLKKVAPNDIAGLFSGIESGQYGEMFGTRSSRLTFSPLHGYMHGFIDLVLAHGEKFYLIDWKSNHLGDTAADYGETAINRAMTESFYFFQYHLYTLALHLHLRSSLPGYSYERHFGGVYYLFLRGIDASQPAVTGVYFDRPGRSLVQRMEKLFIPGVA